MKKTTTTRRPKGEGSITKLPNGNLKMTITLGIGADGKQKRKSVTAKTTKLWVSHDKQVTALAVGMKVHKFLRSSLNVPEGFTFHCFRHYHATQLLLKGINVKEVSKRLGHASIQTTLDIYAHWVPEMDETAANTVDTSLIF